MYEPGTILTLKEPREPETNDKDQEIEFPYNRVEVVGQSPIQHAIAGASWVGAEAQGVIVKPLSGFGSTLDEPYGKLKELYDVESIPQHEAPLAQPVKVINSSSGSAGPTPEEVFKEESPGTPPEAGRRRGRTSPLDGGLTEQEKAEREAKKQEIAERNGS